jgi:hypothetical protein
MLCASYDFVLGAGRYYLYIFLQAFASSCWGLASSAQLRLRPILVHSSRILPRFASL